MARRKCQAEAAPAGSFVARCPVVDRFGRPLALEDAYLDGHVFLVLGGPSLNDLDLRLLWQRGITTFAVNNVGAWVRPNMWTYGDKTLKFHDAIWKDPGILKFAPFPKLHEKIREKLPDGRIVTLSKSPRDMPGVVGVRRNTRFRPEEWLYEDTINWGHGKDGILHYGRPWLEKNRPKDVGNKNGHGIIMAERWNMSEEDRRQYAPYPKVLSTFLQAVRLCYFLGFRHVYLLGCDFSMSRDAYYAFPETKDRWADQDGKRVLNQDATNGAIRSNLSAYAALNELFAALKPHFDKAGFHVRNCNPHSGLRAFEHMPFEEAIAAATHGISSEPDTKGWYDEHQPKED